MVLPTSQHRWVFLQAAKSPPEVCFAIALLNPPILQMRQHEDSAMQIQKYSWPLILSSHGVIPSLRKPHPSPERLQDIPLDRRESVFHVQEQSDRLKIRIRRQRPKRVNQLERLCDPQSVFQPGSLFRRYQVPVTLA